MIHPAVIADDERDARTSVTPLDRRLSRQLRRALVTVRDDDERAALAYMSRMLVDPDRAPRDHATMRDRAALILRRVEHGAASVLA